MLARALITAVVAAWIAGGCQTVRPEGEPTAPRSADAPPAREAPVSAPRPLADGAAPGSPAAKTLAQKLSMQAVELLQDGDVASARSELDRALALDPGSRLANNLMRQITEDPVALLGSESFPYTVGRGESLSWVSQRFLGDVFSFYALARYNGIAVPRMVQAGQVIKVPGKRPPAAPPAAMPAPGVAAPAPSDAAPAPLAKPTTAPPSVASRAPAPETGEATVSTPTQLYASAIEAEQRGDLEQAYRAYTQVVALDPAYRDASARAQTVRAELVRRHHREATAAFHKQDLDTAIREWDRVLELDPTNETAKVNRQRALDLSRRIQQIK